MPIITTAPGRIAGYSCSLPMARSAWLDRLVRSGAVQDLVDSFVNTPACLQPPERTAKPPWLVYKGDSPRSLAHEHHPEPLR